MELAARTKDVKARLAQLDAQVREAEAGSTLPWGGGLSTRAGSTSVLGSAVSPGLVSLQEENMRKEKQLLLDAQRQAALEKEVCLPTFSLLFVPRHLFTCPVRVSGVLRLCWPLSC